LFGAIETRDSALEQFVCQAWPDFEALDCAAFSCAQEDPSGANPVRSAPRSTQLFESSRFCRSERKSAAVQSASLCPRDSY
jgi:hypothetical protein